MNFNIKKIKSDFPILKKKINNNKLIYLDNATTLQKPKHIINNVKNIYTKYYASIHRGTYSLSNKINQIIENTRIKISKFINASSPEEIIFTKNTTNSINLIVNTWAKNNLSYKDNIIISIMEHHANIIPWFLLSKEIQFKIKIIKINKDGNLDLNHFKKLIDKNTKIISITHISNVLGTINPIKKIIKIAKKHNIISLIDGAQAIAHQIINVKEINCDFYVFSAHKIYSSTGTGILFNKNNLLEKYLPWESGGGIIANINFYNNNIKKIDFIKSPWKFEAGTPNIESIINLGIAIDYINLININNIISYEKKILNFLIKKITNIPNIKIYGSQNRTNILSFNIKNYHCYDIGILLDQYGICIRSGNQCALPIMNYYKVPGMCRVSLAMYNSKKDINKFILTLKKIIKKLK